MAMPRFARRVVQAGLEQLFPARCGVCGGWGELLCAGCVAALPRAEGERCALCWSAGAQSPCDPCAAQGPPCTSLRAVYAYEAGVRPLVAALKYRGVAAYAQPAGALMAAAWPSFDLACDVAVPVPLHPRRERWRGYNQAALLAAELAAPLLLPVRPHALARIRPTPPQARTGSAAERAGHMLGAFACAEPQRVRGKAVLLVDDVTTSGATLRACAATLTSAGATAVYGFAFAIA
jgi:ComF family protein